MGIKKFQKSRKTTFPRGFTLIELLIVIGILGILAAALIATIDPFEQLKKANDTSVKNTAVEFVSATARYYTTHSAMPWDTVANGGGGCNSATVPSSTVLTNAVMATCLTSLLNDGELKSGFSSATTTLSKIYVTGTASSVVACFLPTSKAQQRDPNTKYSQSGGAGTSCVSQGGTSLTCYWCSQ